MPTYAACEGNISVAGQYVIPGRFYRESYQRDSRPPIKHSPKGAGCEEVISL